VTTVDPGRAYPPITPRMVHIVRTEGPTSELFVGPFDDGDRLEAWLAENRTPAWTHVQVAPLERPMLRADIPERERAVHDDPELAEQIRRGIDEAERGETVDRGSFAQYLDDDDDEEPCCEDADELSSHYHCAKCGERCSMMGHDDCQGKGRGDDE